MRQPDALDRAGHFDCVDTADSDVCLFHVRPFLSPNPILHFADSKSRKFLSKKVIFWACNPFCNLHNESMTTNKKDETMTTYEEMILSLARDLNLAIYTLDALRRLLSK